MRSGRGAAAKRGFTLLEVMLATAIFGMVLFALSKALEKTLDAASEIRMHNRARAAIEGELAEIRSGPLHAETTKSAPDASGIVCEREIEPVPLENQTRIILTGLYRIRIHARWHGGEEETEVYGYSP